MEVFWTDLDHRWEDFEVNPALSRMRNLDSISFWHELGHALAFIHKKEEWRLFKKNFAMEWPKDMADYEATKELAQQTELEAIAFQWLLLENTGNFTHPAPQISSDMWDGYFIDQLTVAKKIEELEPHFATTWKRFNQLRKENIDGNSI